MTTRERIVSRLAPLLLPAVLLAAWELTVRAQLVPPSHSASPSSVLLRLWELIRNTVLLTHTYHSMIRLLLAVGAGAVLGILTSTCFAIFRTPDRLFSPTVRTLAGVPVVVWIPVWVMFFGTDEAFKISMVAVSTFFLVHTSNFQAVRSVAREYLELADMYEKSYWEKFRHIFLPSTMPAVITAIRVSLAFGWVVLFFVEYASARHGSEGLGWFIADSRAMGRVESEFAGLVFLGIIAFSGDQLIDLLQKRMLGWTHTLETLIAEEHVK